MDRQALIDQLHDHVLQSVIAARQDLDEVAAGDPDALSHARWALDDAIARVRDLMRDERSPS